MNMYLRLAGRLALTMAVLQLGAGQAIAADDERAVGARQADFDQHLKNTNAPDQWGQDFSFAKRW